MPEMRVMGRRGDVKVTWDPENETEVEAARAQFSHLVDQERFAAFALQGGRQGERMHEFAPDTGVIVMVPPMAGGR